jgi:hypothetical protein
MKSEDQWVIELKERLNTEPTIQKLELKAFVKINLPYSADLSYTFNVIDSEKIKKQNVLVKASCNAYQVDLLLTKNDKPFMAIECKMGGISTHGLVTYSDNAKKHKQLFPDLKYGLLLADNNKGKNTLEKKIFMHDNSFDFITCIDSKLSNPILWKNMLDIINNAVIDDKLRREPRSVYCIEKREIYKAQ